jgi:hypothetical protein
VTVDYGIDGETLELIRKRDARFELDRGDRGTSWYDRRILLNIVDRLLKQVDDQAKALRLLQDGIGDIRTEIIKDM